MKPKKTPTAAAAASRYFAYLRVSTDDQNAANQKLGLLEYANAHGFAPLKIVEETGSRAKSWRKRALADVLAEAQRGDVILSPEISRLGESALQVLDFMAEAVAKGVAVHITKQKIVLDGSLQAEIMATVLGLAARIEREFIRARTTEALRVAKANGKRLGRPPGQAAALKLDERADEVAAYLALGLSLTKAAARLEVSKATLSRFIKRRKIKLAKHVEVKGNG